MAGQDGIDEQEGKLQAPWWVVVPPLELAHADVLADAFYEMGGNFIDTANNYQSEESERWVGEWMKARSSESHDRRDHMYAVGF